MIIDQQRIPIGIFHLSYQMLCRTVVFVIGKYESDRRRQTEFCHFRIIKDIPVRVFDAMAELRGSAVCQEIEFPFLSPDGWRIERFRLFLLQLRKIFLFL